MLQSGLISKEQLPHKYKNEIHANEIILLAYYIAAINIEAVYHSLVGGDYVPFEGICLTDTFQLYEKDDMISELLVDNSARRIRQKELDIRVIMGNPPYSAGQKSAGDMNANVIYPNLDSRIRETYAAFTSMTNKKSIYDSYIRAIRWGSDRLGQSGVMAYVSGSAWVERGFGDGIRKCLVEEFSNLYIFHLRGDIRKNMMSKGRAKEGHNIFGLGSMTGTAITLFVKNPKAAKHGRIYYRDIGDDLTSKEKLAIIHNFDSVDGITKADGWQDIVPDKYNDWLDQRDGSFDQFMGIGVKKDKSRDVLFTTYSTGLKTQRDTWCYNSSRLKLEKSIQSSIEFFNDELKQFSKKRKISENIKPQNIVHSDPSRFKWCQATLADIEKERALNFDADSIIQAVYRPYMKQWVYYNKRLNWSAYLMPRIFPHASAENLVIHISGVGARSGFSALMTNQLPDVQHHDNGQCFPLKLYEKIEATKQSDFLAIPDEDSGYRKKDGITDVGLAHFQAAYPKESITKEDLFYYIYGLLHSEDYRTRYADNLSKQLPRIPPVKKATDFWAFVEAGRKLGALHVDYEAVEPYAVIIEGNPKADEDYYVTKMKFGKAGKEKDKTTVTYNDHITIKDIPLEAYDYIVNGKSALDWVMDRQCVKTDKKSGIVNDANLYATETVGNPKYPLELFQRVITVSLETVKIVNALPKFDI